MTDRDIMQEIEDLKKQLQALEANKTHTGAQAAPGKPEEAGGEPGNWLGDLFKQAEELMGGLDLQFKDVPAKTALVIFSLGVLMGRLLSRRG